MTGSAQLDVMIVWLALGLIAGAMAKFLLPGKDPGGFIGTVIIGILGSFLGGYLGNQFGISNAQTGGLSVESVGTAVGGALVLLVAYRILFGRSA